MKSFFRFIGYQFKTAFFNIFRNISMSFISISAISVTLVLVSVFSIVTFNIEYISDNIRSNISIRAGLDLQASSDAKIAIKSEIEKLDMVNNVLYSSREQELELYTQNTQESDNLFKEFSGDKNPLRDVLIINLKSEYQDVNSIKDLAKKISEMNYIATVDYGGNSVETLIKTLNIIKYIGLILSLILSFLAVFLISNTIKATIYSRKKEIGIMKNVGASNNFIRVPFLIEGMFIGFLGSVIPVVFTLFVYRVFYNYLQHILSSQIPLINPMPFTIVLGLFLVILAVVVGLMGSNLAIHTHMENKR